MRPRHLGVCEPDRPATAPTPQQCAWQSAQPGARAEGKTTNHFGENKTLLAHQSGGECA